MKGVWTPSLQILKNGMYVTKLSLYSVRIVASYVHEGPLLSAFVICSEVCH